MEQSMAEAWATRPTAIPRPGDIFCPVGRALDQIGDRWTLVLVRHLLSGPKGFQELRMRTGIAPRVLSSRLRQLAQDGFVESVAHGARSLYGLTERGRSLEPLIAAIARWWVEHSIKNGAIQGTFTPQSPLSVLESLPLILREDRARGAHITFEIRLTGEGGGVWTVQIDDGVCTVKQEFAEHADVRYTADARVWCAVAVGLFSAREAVQQGVLTKDGGHEALDFYFHQITQSERGGVQKESPALESASGLSQRRVM